MEAALCFSYSSSGGSLKMNNYQREFLEWLEERDGYYVSDSEVEENFPDLNVRLVGVTKRYDPESGETKTPKRDYRQAIKYGTTFD